jgi:hypothetical protein
MMSYRDIKTALQALLDEQAESRFRVVGFQRQSKSADETLNNDRLVQVYYSEGDFPKSAGRNKGSKSHDLTIEIDLTASATASVDTSILDSTTATAIQKAAALAELKEAAEEADTKIDELIDAVWNILTDTRNYDLNLEVGAVSSPWIAKITKDTLLERGDLVVKTANMKYTCRVQEYVLGTTGTQPDPAVINSTIPIGDGEIGGSGVEVENAVPS